MDRRDFLAASAATLLLPDAAAAAPATGGARLKAPGKLEYFDYRGVTLRPSRFLDQVRHARDHYFNMPDDDMLKGFRRQAGLPAPGNDMKGWCRNNCDATFGQWLSGMARMSRALNDAPLRAKAIHLVTEWEKTFRPERKPGGGQWTWGTYGWEKMACGLVDLALYADHAPALDILARMTVWARDNFDRARSPAIATDRDGRRPKGTLEWYTLAENSLRAYAITGDKLHLDFANLWHYPDFWDQFLTTSRPVNAGLLHSYSHVNTFSSVAMLHAATGEPRFLTILKNGYD